MKRVGNLWPLLISWPNLISAGRKARLGKSGRPDVQRFQFNLEYELLNLQESLANETYRPGPFRTFEVFDPKRRQISAAAFHDRVVHHAVCNVLEPVFEQGFSFDSYANRLGKGTCQAILRARKYARSARFVLKADIARFFPSVDHQVLLELLQRRLRDKPLIRLLETIIRRAYPGQRRGEIVFPGDDLFTRSERAVGLPIGNQTSQFFGNVYLNPMDHFVKQDLRCPGYVRYMDDFVLFSDSKSHLQQCQLRLREFLVPFRIRLHPTKTNLIGIADGFRFLGVRVLPNRIKVCRDNVTRFRRRMKRLDRHYQSGQVALESIRNSIFGWWGYARQAAPPAYLRKIIAEFSFYEDLVNQAKNSRARLRRATSAPEEREKEKRS